MKCEIPLTPEQKIFATQNHDLIYKFLNENHLSEDDFYDVIAIGYLRSIRRFFSNPQLHQYSFCTVAWKGMQGALNDYNKAQHGQRHTANILSIHTELGDEIFSLEESFMRYKDLMTQLEVELLLHDLAKAGPSASYYQCAFSLFCGPRKACLQTADGNRADEIPWLQSPGYSYPPEYFHKTYQEAFRRSTQRAHGTLLWIISMNSLVSKCYTALFK